MFFLKKIKKYYKEGKDFVAVDLETTGFNPKKMRLLKLAPISLISKEKKKNIVNWLIRKEISLRK